MVVFKKIGLNQSEWTSIIRRSYQYDFYHTLSYNKLEKEGRSTLFVAEKDDDFIAFPLVIREIPNTSLYDCTSVYGYCGPISNLSVDNISDELIHFFAESLLNYFQQENIVSVFCRLHPLIEIDKIIEKIGGKIIKLNKTIAVDLKLTEAEQRKQYRKSNKYEINKLKRNSFEIIEAKSEEELDAFIDIYCKTMRRVDAKEDYFFSKQYFYNFLQNTCFTSKLLLAKKEGVVTAGAIFTITKKIMQYHLAGTKKEYIRDAPMKLILEEARIIGNKLGLDYLHLGGGIGGSDEDSLFKFKSGFSKTTFQYKIWKFIVHESKYNELVASKNITKEKNSFFPLYRG